MIGPRISWFDAICKRFLSDHLTAFKTTPQPTSAVPRPNHLAEGVSQAMSWPQVVQERIPLVLKWAIEEETAIMIINVCILQYLEMNQTANAPVYPYPPILAALERSVAAKSEACPCPRVTA